jgi:glycosyltransferase involved in cell wall biosynthesis
MARRATMIVTPSSAVRQEVCELLKVSPDKVVAVHHAPRAEFKPLAREQTIETRNRLGIDDSFLLFVGTIEPRKNLVRLVQAYEQVLETTDARPQLVIAGGEGWLTDDLFKRVGQSRFADRVKWTGYLADEDLRALYSSCRLFIYPSLYEGFGFPPLEAMACGAPVITSRIPVITEVVGDAAHLVSPENINDLAQSIISLLESPEELGRLSAAGRKRAGEFSWDRTARQTHGVYLEAIQKHSVKRRRSSNA